MLESEGLFNRLESAGKTELPSAYQGSEIVQMIDRQKKNYGFVFALSTDIDNTLRRKYTDQARDLHSKNTTFNLASLASEKDIPIMTVTGNDYETVLKRIQSGDLPYVSIIAGAVGTEVWILHKDQDGNPYYVKDGTVYCSI